MEGGTSARYYRCQTYKKKRLCTNDRSVREDVARTKILTAIREHLLSPEGIAHTRKRVAGELRDYSNKLATELSDRRERLERTEAKMRGLVDFIATGDRSEYVVSTLHDLEAFTRQEREALAELERASHEPLRLPSIEEVCTQVADLDARLAQDPEAGREQMRRWLKDGTIRIGPTKDGAIAAEGEILPLIVISDGGGRKGNYAKPSPMVSRSSIGVAGAGFISISTRFHTISSARTKVRYLHKGMSPRCRM